MDRALLDTDIYSEILRAKNITVLKNAAAYRQQFGVLTISAPTVVELVAGLQRTGRIVRLGEITTALAAEVVLPFDQDAAIIAGQIHGELARTGQTIGRMDPMIAAIAITHDLTLITGNTRHYQRVISLGFSLRLDNWRT